jgi:hypothetical protein
MVTKALITKVFRAFYFIEGNNKGNKFWFHFSRSMFDISPVSQEYDNLNPNYSSQNDE